MNAVERYRKVLDSPHGNGLHDLAEIEILAGDLRELVAIAETGGTREQESEA